MQKHTDYNQVQKKRQLEEDEDEYDEDSVVCNEVAYLANKRRKLNFEEKESKTGGKLWSIGNFSMRYKEFLADHKEKSIPSHSFLTKMFYYDKMMNETSELNIAMRNLFSKIEDLREKSVEEENNSRERKEVSTKWSMELKKYEEEQSELKKKLGKLKKASISIIGSLSVTEFRVMAKLTLSSVMSASSGSDFITIDDLNSISLLPLPSTSTKLQTIYNLDQNANIDSPSQSEKNVPKKIDTKKAQAQLHLESGSCQERLEEAKKKILAKLRRIKLIQKELQNPNLEPTATKKFQEELALIDSFTFSE